ncbi:MAG TPA: hypothetical protein ENN90_08435 [Mariniphaga anaerophila]|uniref:Uncharacterized protein n=1 Tax=Mariniphaga anaerophila TaxID=1484053 RepID=A0A831LLA7_9BACT|nr:hypothetical protein [Mariniphaga anaerophila]
MQVILGAGGAIGKDLAKELKTWKQQWPPIMQNVISACKKHRCKLVFFDNMDMYDRDYEFDSSKFETVFNVKPTAAEEVLKQIANGNSTAKILYFPAINKKLK